MYDVLEKESINEMLKLRCIEDAVEKELIRKYAEENSDNNPFSKSQWKKFSFDCLQNDSLSIPLYFEDTVFEVPTYRKKKNKPYLDRQKKPPENSFNRS